jgi:hypothetical protein
VQAAMPYVPLTNLWLPIVLAAAICWVLSALFWTVSPHHRNDFARLPNEDQTLSALRQANLTPGEYRFPQPSTMAESRTPEFRKKLETGPIGILTIQAPDVYVSMGKPMALSVVYYLVVSVFVAYVAGRTLAPGVEYLQVFRITGAVAFMAYAIAIVPDAIWWGRGWGRVGKHTVDSLVHALFTAGVFGWLWPGA